MTIMYMLSIRDRAVNAYGRPMVTPSIGATIREFGDELNRNAPDNPLAKHPEDYDLYILAEFDDETGQFTNRPQPEMIAVGKNMVIRQGE